MKRTLPTILLVALFASLMTPLSYAQITIVRSTIFERTGHAVTDFLPGGLNAAFTGIPVLSQLGADSTDVLLEDAVVPGLNQVVVVDVELNLLNERNVDPFELGGEFFDFVFTLNPELPSLGTITLVQTSVDDGGPAPEGFYMRETTIELLTTLTPLGGGTPTIVPGTVFVRSPVPIPFSFDPGSNVAVREGLVGDETASVHTNLTASQKNFHPFDGLLQVPLGGRSQFDGAGTHALRGNQQSAVFAADAMGDFCPDDPAKVVPGLTGCGNSDADTNLDGLPDFYDSSLAPGGTAGGRYTRLVYTPTTGRVALSVPPGVGLRAANISSASGIFTGDLASNLGGPFDEDTDVTILKATLDQTFGTVIFGNVAQTGLSKAQLLEDVTVRVMFDDMKTFGGVDLIVESSSSASSSALGLNMGFKLNYPLDSVAGGISASGTNTLALPYRQQTSLVNVSELFDDINATEGGSALSISKLIRSSDTLLTYAGTNPANDFALKAGEGYFVQVSADVPYLSVGTHDPGLVVQLDAAGTNNSASGTNFFAFPYHGVAASASDLTTEINGFVPGAVLSVSRLLRQSDTLQSYGGTNPANDFALRPGTAYLIQVQLDVPYVPAHY